MQAHPESVPEGVIAEYQSSSLVIFDIKFLADKEKSEVFERKINFSGEMSEMKKEVQEFMNDSLSLKWDPSLNIPENN